MAKKPTYPQVLTPTEWLTTQLTRFPMWELRDLRLEKRTASFVVATFDLVGKERHTVTPRSIGRAKVHEVEQALVELLEEKDRPKGKGLAVRTGAPVPGPLRPYDEKRDKDWF